MNPKSFQLTLEQQFALRRMRQQMQDLTTEQVRESLVQASRLLFLKDNAIKSLVKDAMAKGLPSLPSQAKI